MHDIKKNYILLKKSLQKKNLIWSEKSDFPKEATFELRSERYVTTNQVKGRKEKEISKKSIQHVKGHLQKMGTWRELIDKENQSGKNEKMLKKSPEVKQYKALQAR